jgi:KH domain-containing RNA-binding signal transduction-associated protein 3
LSGLDDVSLTLHPDFFIPQEEECRNTLDPKYSHLSEDLHVEIVSLAPPAEAHARIAYALAEIRKYLVPDNNDEIRLEQLREIQASSGPQGRGRAPSRGGPHRHPGQRGITLPHTYQYAPCCPTQSTISLPHTN